MVFFLSTPFNFVQRKKEKKMKSWVMVVVTLAGGTTTHFRLQLTCVVGLIATTQKSCLVVSIWVPLRNVYTVEVGH